MSTMPATEKIERIYRLRAGLLDMRNSVAPMLAICNQLRRHDFAVKVSEIRPAIGRSANSECGHFSRFRYRAWVV